MNKKFLGILSIGILGVSAAFASVTSTVYFTSSGTLTKYISPLGKETSKGSSATHADEIGVGISYVETSLSNNAKKIYGNKEYTNGSACDVSYSINGKFTTNNTGDYSATNPYYLYREIVLENITFYNKGDYIFLPFYVYNTLDSNRVRWTYYEYQFSINSTSINGYYLTDIGNINNKQLLSGYIITSFSLSNASSICSLLNSVSDPTSLTYNALSTAESVNYLPNGSSLCGLFLKLNSEVEESDLGEFSTTIKLKDFGDTKGSN